MKPVLPLRHRTGVVMVTECTAWYPNARWSSRLKERLLAVLESRAPHWADIFGLFSSNTPPSQISPSWKMDYGYLSDYLYPQISKSFPLWASPVFCHTSTDCGAKSMRAVTKDDDRASHTHAISQEPRCCCCWWTRTIYSEGLRVTKILNFTFI